jgi:hypothetical protein
MVDIKLSRYYFSISGGRSWRWAELALRPKKNLFEFTRRQLMSASSKFRFEKLKRGTQIGSVANTHFAVGARSGRLADEI